MAISSKATVNPNRIIINAFQMISIQRDQDHVIIIRVREGACARSMMVLLRAFVQVIEPELNVRKDCLKTI